MIYGIDISKARTGLAVGRAGETPKTVSIVGAKLDVEIVAVKLFCYLRDRVKLDRPDLLVWEAGLNPAAFTPEVNFEEKTVRNKRGIQSMLDLVEMISAVKLFCNLASIETRRVYPSTIRKEVLGNGRLHRDVAKKSVVAMCGLLNWPVNNDDEADAASLWHYGVCLKAPRLAKPILPSMHARVATMVAGSGSASSGLLRAPIDDEVPL